MHIEYLMTMDITPDLPFLNIHNPVTNERIRYTWTNNRMSLNTKDYFVKQISHVSKCVVIVASA